MTIVPLKRVCREVDVRAGADEPQLLSVSIHRGVVPRIELTDDEPRADDLSNYKICEPGDVVLNRMRAFQGAIGVADQRGIVSPDYLVLRPSPTAAARYLHYAFRSSWFIGQMTSRIRGIGSVESGMVRTPRINASDLLEIELDLPALDEQQRIADFLDDQVARIDNIIAARRNQIELVRESVSHVLVDVAREQGAAVLGSPLAWFPAWRQEWTVQRLAWVVRCLDGQRVPLNGVERSGREGEYPYYGASAIVDHIDGYLFDGDFVLVGEDGASLGNPRFDVVQRVSGKVWVNNHAHILQATAIDVDYLAHFMRCVDRPLLISGATRPKITQEDLLSIPIVVPPTDSQAKLVTGCGERINQNERSIALLREHVARMGELKSSLITAAVIREFDVSSADGSQVRV